MIKLLKNHTSAETAFLVEDYPYGFRLRCKIRYWIEFNPKHGFRFVSQTTNPKRGNAVWNKPKTSTYAMFGAAMFLDDQDHVQWAGLNEYCNGAEAKAWLDKYSDGVPTAGLVRLQKWVAAKLAYEGARKEGDPLSVGFAEACKVLKGEE